MLSPVLGEWIFLELFSKISSIFHDRFLILDKKYVYHIGASIKDAGKKCFGITLIKYDAIIKDILDHIKLLSIMVENWKIKLRMKTVVKNF